MSAHARAGRHSGEGGSEQGLAILEGVAGQEVPTWEWCGPRQALPPLPLTSLLLNVVIGYKAL